MVGRNFSQDMKTYLLQSHTFNKDGTSFAVFNNENTLIASYST